MGGKARNMHRNKRTVAMARRNKSKTIVLGILDVEAKSAPRSSRIAQGPLYKAT